MILSKNAYNTTNSDISIVYLHSLISSVTQSNNTASTDGSMLLDIKDFFLDISIPKGLKLHNK